MGTTIPFAVPSAFACRDVWPIASACIGAFGFLFGLYQWIRTRRQWLYCRFELRRLQHQRLLILHVQNRGADFHYPKAFFRRKAVPDVPMKPGSETTAALKWLQWYSLYIENPDPSVSLGLEDLTSYDVSIQIYSDNVPTKTIKGRKFKRLLDEFSAADPTMPPRPQPPQHDGLIGVLDYRGKW